MDTNNTNSTPTHEPQPALIPAFVTVEELKNGCFSCSYPLNEHILSTDEEIKNWGLAKGLEVDGSGCNLISNVRDVHLSPFAYLKTEFNPTHHPTWLLPAHYTIEINQGLLSVTWESRRCKDFNSVKAFLCGWATALGLQFCYASFADNVPLTDKTTRDCITFAAPGTDRIALSVMHRPESPHFHEIPDSIPHAMPTAPNEQLNPTTDTPEEMEDCPPATTDSEG